MIDKDIAKHAREFQRYINNHQWEAMDNGALLLPRANAMIRGRYFFYSNDGENPDVSDNLITIEGLNYILEAALRGGASYNQYYMALFDGAYTPNPLLTAANFSSGTGELVSNSEGYSEVSRPLWQSESASDGVTSNQANKCAFTIASSSSVTIRGGALLSDSTKGGTSGVLISISRFNNDRVEHNGNVFNAQYSIEIVSP